MNAVLDCDDVFDVLTRAPFPAGDASDAIVERHLAACHECRQLAEALRPALGLVHEALAEDSLPCYSGNLVALARQNAATPTHHARGGWAMIVAAAAASLCFWLANRASDSFNGPHRQTQSTAQREIPDEAGCQAILALGLPPACRHVSRDISRFAMPHPKDSLVGLLDDTDREFHCCTRCHSEGSPVSSSPRAILAAVKVCATCHAPRVAEVKA